MTKLPSTKTPKRPPQGRAVKVAGRPVAQAQRQHLFLPEDALNAMAECDQIMDAHGPSEVIRVALMHLDLLLSARELGLRLASQTVTSDRPICGLLDTYEPQTSERKTHITMTPAAKERLTICSNKADIQSPSGTVALALLLLRDYMAVVNSGEVVLLAKDGDPILGFSPWLKIEAIRKALRVVAKEQRQAA